MIEINIHCGKCRSRNLLTLSDRDTRSVTCAACGARLFSARVIAGYIYVLSNPAMPGLLKIGCTTRQVEDRLTELNAPTGVPSPFKVEAFAETSEPYDDEAKVHKRLEKYRLEGREFFRISVTEAVAILHSVLGVAPSRPGLEKATFSPTRFLNNDYQPVPAPRPGTYSCGLCKYTWDPGMPIDKMRSPSMRERPCPKCGSSATVRLA